MQNWKTICKVLKQLEIDLNFYRRSLNRVSENPTQDNYQVFVEDAKKLNELERELYKLSHKEGDN